MNQFYGREFFSHNQATANSSAQIVVPLVHEWAAPASVADLGCGTGSWLAEFRKLGVDDVLGIDGDYVDRAMLLIPAHRFVAHDLTTNYKTDRRFDLAMSLEVAEHLPEQSGPSLVEALVALAPVVLFSAAIPHQRGVNHVNCQWPSYWSELFEQHGYVVVDALRTRFWENAEVAWWYRQNMMLFAAQEALAGRPKLAELHRYSPSPPPRLIHPELLEWWVKWGLEQSKLYWDLALDELDSGGSRSAPHD